jgi:hypothetical protein
MRNQARIKMLWWTSVLLLVLSACKFKFQEMELTELPIETSANAQDVNVDIIVRHTQDQVQEVLPRSYLVAFGFTGQCQELPALRGQMDLEFVQVKSFTFHRQVLVAFASVDTIQGTLDIRTRDFSDRYWSTDPLPPQNVSVAKEISQVAHQHITDLGILDCDVTLSCVGNKVDIWHVLCTEPGSGPTGSHLCEFEINAVTGQIVDANQ